MILEGLQKAGGYAGVAFGVASRCGSEMFNSWDDIVVVFLDVLGFMVAVLQVTSSTADAAQHSNQNKFGHSCPTYSR